MNKYVLSLSLLALANAFQPAQSMNWISQPNKDRIAKYGPYVAATTAAVVAGVAGVYAVKNLDRYTLYCGELIPFGPYDPQGFKGTLNATLRGQVKQLGYAGLSALAAYMSTSNVPSSKSQANDATVSAGAEGIAHEAPVDTKTESRAASALANLKNKYETAKKEFNTLSPRAITCFKVAGTIVAAALAAKAAHSISSLETACYMRNTLCLKASVSQHIAGKLVSPFTLGGEIITRYRLVLAVITAIGAGTAALNDDI